VKAIGLFIVLAAAANAYDTGPWLQDLNQAEQALATKYANLEWAVFEHETNLTALFAETKAQIEAASDASEARAALDRLARKLGDGHVRFRWRAQADATETPAADCSALGYDARMFGMPVAALAPGYLPLPSSAAAEFPAGTVAVGGHKLGVIKIGIFTPQGIPELCTAALAASQIPPGASCDDACADRIEAWASDRMTADLAKQLRALKAAGAELLLVDVANNGGGTEWAEAAARMVTAIPLKSERVGFVRGPHWAGAFAKKAAELRATAEKAAEEFTAVLQDNHAAIVMGIQPDVLVGLASQDGPHRQGLKVAARLPAAVARALALQSSRSSPKTHSRPDVYGHISRASSTMSCSFFNWASEAMSLPCSVLAKPHCGESASCSSGA
jgi:hypothetical protein